MNNSIANLFDAIHYCNKMVKTHPYIDKETVREFYNKKRNLLFFIIKNHKSLNVEIIDCHIDLQTHSENDKTTRLYAFHLSYGETQLKVHQTNYSKMGQLIEILNIPLSEMKEYESTVDETLQFKLEKFNSFMNVINEFHDKWGLAKYAFNLNDPILKSTEVYESFVYFFPDFKFEVEDDKKIIGKNSIIKVIHIKSRRVYRMRLNMLKANGEKFLPIWRKKNRKAKFLLTEK